MSTGHLLIAVGVGLDILATLFLSIDLLRSQKGINKYFAKAAYIERMALSVEDLERSIARTPLPGTTPEQLALEATERIFSEASLEAAVKNRTGAVADLEGLTDDFHHHLPLVEAAIVTVVVGGLLNLTSVIFFGS